MALIPVTRAIAIDENEIEESFVRASGAGGQNIQRVSSAVRLRFDILGSPNLPEPVRRRLLRLGGSRVSRDGVLVIAAQEHRTQARNRQAALERLLELLRQAAAPPPPVRRPTRPTLGSQTRRLDAKAGRAAIKAGRGRIAPEG